MCIIGASGHWPYALEGASQSGGAIEICGIAPGSENEDISALISACEKRGFAPDVYPWWKECLDEQRPDIAAIDPWFCDSAEISMYALRHGIHVYSEKPLACDMDTLRRLKAVYEASGCDLGGMFDGRHTPWLRTVKKAVDDGLIGEIRLLNGRKSYKFGTRGPVYEKIATYGGMLPWIAIHPMSWFDYLLGEHPTAVSGMADDRCNRGVGEIEMTGCMLVRYPNGVLATVSTDYFRPDGAPRHDDDRIMVTGTKGFIEVKDGSVWLENDEPRRMLENVPGEQPFLHFAASIGTPEAKRLADTAFTVTEWCLRARDGSIK